MKVDIVGSTSESEENICVSYDGNMQDLVHPLLEGIASMDAFYAWMRETVKAKNR